MAEGSRIWLFVSQADDTRRVGDVDLYGEPAHPPSTALPVAQVCLMSEQLALRNAVNHEYEEDTARLRQLCSDVYP